MFQIKSNQESKLNQKAWLHYLVHNHSFVSRFKKKKIVKKDSLVQICWLMSSWSITFPIYLNLKESLSYNNKNAWKRALQKKIFFWLKIDFNISYFENIRVFATTTSLLKYTRFSLHKICFFQDLWSQQIEQNKTVKIRVFQMKSRTKIK